MSIGTQRLVSTRQRVFKDMYPHSCHIGHSGCVQAGIALSWHECGCLYADAWNTHVHPIWAKDSLRRRVHIELWDFKIPNIPTHLGGCSIRLTCPTASTPRTEQLKTADRSVLGLYWSRLLVTVSILFLLCPANAHSFARAGEGVQNHHTAQVSIIIIK